jgi:hypothetical protein
MRINGITNFATHRQPAVDAAIAASNAKGALLASPAGAEAGGLSGLPSRARTAALHPKDLDMSRAVKVISAAQKFILPVPRLPDGVPLVYPGGQRDKDGGSIEGQPISDWQGNPVGTSGVVFRNWKDQTIQAVPGDGTGVIIFNEATAEQAAALTARITALAGTPAALTHAQVEAVLDTAKELGLTDRYNSDRGFIAGKMTPVGGLGADHFGLYKRDDRDICLAVRLEGRGTFTGPAGTPQRYEDGAVIVKQGDAFRLIQTEVFERTYRTAGNEPVDARTLPEGRKAQGPAGMPGDNRPE